MRTNKKLINCFEKIMKFNFVYCSNDCILQLWAK